MLDVKYTVKSVYWDVPNHIVLSFPLCCHSVPAYGVCVSVGESVYAYVSSHAYVRAHKHQNEAISTERETRRKQYGSAATYGPS